MAETSNGNLIWKVDHLLAVSKLTNTNDLSWVGPLKPTYDTSKFKLTC